MCHPAGASTLVKKHHGDLWGSSPPFTEPCPTRKAEAPKAGVWGSAQAFAYPQLQPSDTMWGQMDALYLFYYRSTPVGEPVNLRLVSPFVSIGVYTISKTRWTPFGYSEIPSGIAPEECGGVEQRDNMGAFRLAQTPSPHMALSRMRDPRSRSFAGSRFESNMETLSWKTIPETDL